MEPVHNPCSGGRPVLDLAQQNAARQHDHRPDSCSPAGIPGPDFTLSDSDGKTYTLSELHGRGVLVNLWASWCLPCRSEMPALERVYQQYRDQGFEILAVNVTNQDSQPAALDFADELGLTFPILYDNEGTVSGEYELRALPTSFFVGPDGTIQEVVIGGPMSEALLRVRVENLVKSISTEEGP
jgi:peroxiredoxin